MAKDDFDFSRPGYLPSEGNRGFRALCGLAAALGPKDPCHQLMNNDGSCVGDLICFLEDNPGAIKAIYDWVEEEYEDEIMEMREESEEGENEDTEDSEEE